MQSKAKIFFIALIYWANLFSSVALSETCSKKTDPDQDIKELKAEKDALEKRAQETVIEPLNCDAVPNLQGSNESHFYPVKSGDFLSKIAADHGFPPSEYKVIWKLHNQRSDQQITDPHSIRPGLKLYIPSTTEFNDAIKSSNVTKTNIRIKALPQSDSDLFESNTNINIGGSSTVYPLTVRAAECYRQSSRYKGTIKINSSGTKKGIEKLCEGHIDIANASKQPDDNEAIKYGCNNDDNKLIKFHVAVDAVGIFINKNNQFLKNNPDISIDLNEDLPGLLNNFTDWKELYRHLNTGDNNLIEPPPEKILKYLPTLKSGTLEFLVEKMFQKQLPTDDSERGRKIQKWKEELTCNATTTTEDDFMVADMVAKNRNAIGVLGFSYTYKNSDLVPIKINGDEPIYEKINNGYKLVRNLYVYTTSSRIKQKSKAICGFLDYYLNTVDNYSPSKGYAKREDATKNISINELRKACSNQ